MKQSAWLLTCSGLLLAGCSSSANLITQWEHTGGPYAQNITAVLAPEHAPAKVYVGLDNGDVCGSTDGGKIWTKLSTIQPGATVYQILAHPEAATTLYAATAAGAFVSSNEGKDWLQLPVGGLSVTTLPCRSLAIDPWKPTVLFAGTTGRGLFVSTDAGGTWTPIVTGEDAVLSFGDVYDIQVDVLKPDLIYAAVSPVGIVRSSDAGATWSRLTDEYTTSNMRITHLLVSRKHAGEIVFGTDTGHLFKSTDGGASWSPVHQGPEHDRIHSLAVHPANSDFLLAGTETGILRSTDFGSSWQSMPGSLGALPVAAAISTHGTSAAFYAFGEGVGLQASSDSGMTWSPIDQNLGGSTVWLIESSRNGDDVYAVAGRTVFRYDSAGSAWVNASNGTKGMRIHAIAIDPDTSSILYLSTPVGVFRTNNKGQSWQQAFRKLSIVPTFLDTHPSIRTRMYAAGETGIFLSTDRGNSWAQAKPFRTGYTIRSFTFTPTNAGIIHGATAEGVIGTGDGGFTWTPARFGLTSNDIVALTLAADDPQTLFAWTSRGECFRSTNRGLEWNQYTPPWDLRERVDLAFDRYKPSSVVAVVGGTKVYTSTSGGNTWEMVIEKRPALDVMTTHWNSESQILYIGTKERGVFQLPLGQILTDRYGE